jgi:type IV pilus assembly protein PilN
MFRIDINLLNDRPELSTGSPSSSTYADTESKAPLLFGGGIAAGLVGLLLLSLAGLSLFNQQLVGREQSLDSDLKKLSPELAKIDELKKQETLIVAETNALAKVFNQIKPWSATLQDLRDRVPPALQLTKVEQVVVAPPAGGQPSPSPSPSPSPATGGTAPQGGTAPAAPPPPVGSDLKLAGNALNFGDINDFELTLRKSPFLKADQTKLMSSQRTPPNEQASASLIQYEMNTQLSDVPASELLQVLNAKGASGLVSRIELLKRQGVMKP